MYSKRDNIAELYELKAQLKEIKQGEQSVSKYYGSLSHIWQQIDSFEVYRWSGPTDEQIYKSIKETERIFSFLAGLHKDFDAVRSRILGTKPLPSMSATFSEIRQEESRIKVMLGPNSTKESSALVTGTKTGVHETQSAGLSVKRHGGVPIRGNFASIVKNQDIHSKNVTDVLAQLSNLLSGPTRISPKTWVSLGGLIACLGLILKSTGGTLKGIW